MHRLFFAVLLLAAGCDGAADTGVLPDDLDGDAHVGAADCDEADPTVFVGATEVCDGVDQDCDGVVDPDDSADAGTWFHDGDGDGYGDAADPRTACAQPSDAVADATDCDDANGAVHPDAPEVCNGVDDDCDRVTDPATSVDVPTWHPDTDGDGYGSVTSAARACTAPGSFVADGTDCVDTDPAVNPGAAELCNDVDDDCDGVVDPPGSAGGAAWSPDQDRDGYGGDGPTQEGCVPPEGYASVDGDCDDADPGVNPGAVEVRDDGVDQDCYGGDLVCADVELRDALGVVAEGTTEGAGDDVAATCGGAGGEDLVFHWVAPADGVYSVYSGTDEDTVLVLLDAGCDGAERVCEATDEAGGPAGALSMWVSAGDERAFVVDAEAGGSTGFRLTIDAPDESVCDDGLDDGAGDGGGIADGLVDCLDPECADDEACTLLHADADLGSATGDAVATGTTVGAGNDWAGSCGGDRAEDVAYGWVAPSAGTYTFSLAGSAYDTVLEIWAMGGEAVCADDGSDMTSSAAYTARAGERILVVVDGRGRNSGEYVLSVL